jgi:hypothetical protein
MLFCLSISFKFIFKLKSYNFWIKLPYYIIITGIDAMTFENIQPYFHAFQIIREASPERVS